MAFPLEEEMTKKERPRCENCGDPTNFGNATGPRAKLKWCGPCYKQASRETLRKRGAGADMGPWMPPEDSAYRNREYGPRKPFDGGRTAR